MGHTRATMVELPWEEGCLLGGGSGGGSSRTRRARHGTRTVLHERPRTFPDVRPAGWAEAPLASLDLETTGCDPNTDHILALALYRQEPDEEPVAIVDTLVDPGADIAIPAEAAAVHGITRERLDVEAAPPVATVLAEVHDALLQLAAEPTGVVIYNAPFDWPLLAAELARLEPPRWLPSCHLIDPLVLDRHVDRYRKGKRTLEVACQVYDVPLDHAHEAGADALASLGVARAIGQRYPEVGQLNLSQLHAIQVDAHRAWRDSFNAYLRRVDADRPLVSGGWPGVVDPDAARASAR